MSETLRDKNSKVIGTLRTSGSTTTLYNAAGSKLGWFDASRNTTYNTAGSVVAKSNILVTLLKN
jgi:YD repeat-containing protein